jgi:hypothetical protein
MRRMLARCVWTVRVLLTRRTEPDFVKSIRLRKGLFFDGIVPCQDRILAPVRGSFCFGGAREGIVIECFRIALKSADRSVSFVCQDDLCPGQRDVLGFSADPEGNDAVIAFRDVSLVRTGADVCHYAVKIHASRFNKSGSPSPAAKESKKLVMLQSSCCE